MSDSDCADGAECNSRGYCTVAKSREAGECSGQAILPKDIILSKWQEVEDAILVLAEKHGVPGRDAEKVAATLLLQGYIQDNVSSALTSLTKWRDLAKKDKQGKVIKQSDAGRFILLADKVLATLDKM